MSEKKVPNPYGRHGGPEHKELVNEIFEDIEKRGLSPIKEFFLNLFGINKKRFVEVVAREGNTKKEYHQVGRINKNGQPIKRERDVINEIQNEYNTTVTFHAYNTDKE